jgi:hypothetical protein
MLTYRLETIVPPNGEPLLTVEAKILNYPHVQS